MDPWEGALWKQIERKSLTEGIVYAGEIITYLQQHLVPELANYRRQLVLQALKQDGMTNGVLAETIGARPGTVARLAEEGRKAQRQTLEEVAS